MLTHGHGDENGDVDNNQQAVHLKRIKDWKRGEFQRNSARRLRSQNESNRFGDVGNCRWFTGSSVIERASSQRPTFINVKAALYTSSIPIDRP